MRLIAVAALCVASIAAHAQSTWASLHWGESREQVRSQLTSLGIRTELDSEGSLQSISDYQLTLPGMRNAFPFHSEFHFTPDNHLINIVLALDVPAMRQNFGYVGNDESILLFAAHRLGRALTDKYGPVLEQNDDCTADASEFAKRAAACTVNLHTLYESIELDWNTRPPHLFIRYQMLSPDL